MIPNESTESPLEDSSGNDDLRTQLASALKEASANAAAKDAPVVADPVAAKPTENATGEARDDKGRFAAKPAEAAAPASATPSTQTTEVSPIVDAAPVPRKAPESLSAAAKAKWSELAPDWQAEIERREAEQHRFITRSGEDLKLARQMRSVLEPHMQTIQQIGLDPVTAVDRLFNADRILRSGNDQQKMAAIRDLAASYQIDLSEFANIPPLDPYMVSLQQRNATLEADRERALREQQYESQSAIQSELEAFASDPEHKYFHQVSSHMAPLLANGVAKDLKDAYQQATWAHPEVRASLLAEQAAQAETKRKADEQQRVIAAKSKTVSLKGSLGAAAAPNGNGEMTLRDQIRESLRSATGRM